MRTRLHISISRRGIFSEGRPLMENAQAGDKAMTLLPRVSPNAVDAKGMMIQV